MELDVTKLLDSLSELRDTDNPPTSIDVYVNGKFRGSVVTSSNRNSSNSSVEVHFEGSAYVTVVRKWVLPIRVVDSKNE